MSDEISVDALSQAADTAAADDAAAFDAAVKVAAGAPEVQEGADDDATDDSPPADDKSDKEKYAERVAKKRGDDDDSSADNETEDDADSAQAGGDDEDEKPPKKLTRKERRAQYRREQKKRWEEASRAERERNEQVLAQIRAEKLAIEAARNQGSELERIRAEMSANPQEAMQRYFGVTADQYAAGALDTQSVHPAILQELEESRRERTELRKLLEDRDKQARQRAMENDHRMRVEHDIRNIVGVTKTKHAEEYPFFCALHPSLQEQMAREYHAKALRENPHIRLHELLDELDEAAEPIVQHIRGPSNGARRGNSEKPRDKETREASSKSPGRGRARAAAEPANRGELTDAEARQNALRVAREAAKQR